MINTIFSLLTNSLSGAWQLTEGIILVLWMYGIKRYKISGRKTALIGFFALFVTMLLNIFSFDQLAGMVAEYALLFFAISFIQEFYHFLKHENE